jgi:hypothetical protein
MRLKGSYRRPVLHLAAKSKVTSPRAISAAGEPAISSFFEFLRRDDPQRRAMCSLLAMCLRELEDHQRRCLGTLKPLTRSARVLTYHAARTLER